MTFGAGLLSTSPNHKERDRGQKSRGISLNNLGLVYRNLGKYHKATEGIINIRYLK